MKFLQVSDEPFYQIDYLSSGPRGETRYLTLPFFKAIVDALPTGIQCLVITSDLQGRELNRTTNRLIGELVAEELKILVELGEIPNIDLIALAGDLYDYPDLQKLGGTGDITCVWNAFCENFDHLVGVHGNHDLVDDQLLSSKAIVLDGTCVEINRLKIGGVSGIIGRSDRNQRKNQQDFEQALKRVLKSKTDLILLHQGPKDRVNNQFGEGFITDMLEKSGHSILAFGHCHWDKPFIEIGNNQVLNVDNRLYVITAANA